MGDGDRGIETVYGEEKIFFTGPTRAAKAEQHFFIPARQAQRTNEASVGNPFIFNKITVLYMKGSVTRFWTSGCKESSLIKPLQPFQMTLTEAKIMQ
jgi:hypothetical protein